MRSRRITVLHVIHDLRFGGTERRMLSVLGTLDRDRFEPRVACILGLGEFAEDVRALGIEPVVIGRRSRADWSGLPRLAGLVRSERADIVHGWLFLANLYAIVGGRLGWAPVVIAAEGGAVTTRSARKRALHAAVGRALAPATDAFVANSEAVAAALRATVPPGKVVVIRNGVDVGVGPTPAEVERARASIAASPGPVVGMVSRLDPHFKDHGTFLRAAARVAATRPETTFTIVGDGPGRREIERQVRELGLGDRVVLTGFRPDARAVIAALDVSVLLSFSEGLSNVLLESMALARPVVATAIAPNRELVEDGRTGTLVPVGDVAATADAIVALLNDPHEAQLRGLAARARVASEFSLEAQAERTMALYERLLARKRR